jgi:hypothetical protein
MLDEPAEPERAEDVFGQWKGEGGPLYLLSTIYVLGREVGLRLRFTQRLRRRIRMRGMNYRRGRVVRRRPAACPGVGLQHCGWYPDAAPARLCCLLKHCSCSSAVLLYIPVVTRRRMMLGGVADVSECGDEA